VEKSGKHFGSRFYIWGKKRHAQHQKYAFLSKPESSIRKRRLRGTVGISQAKSTSPFCFPPQMTLDKLLCLSEGFFNLVFIITPILKEDKVVSGFKTPTRAAYSHIEEFCGCRSSGLLRQLLLRDAIKQQHSQLQEALKPRSILGCVLQITESHNSQITKCLHVLVVKNLHEEQESCGQDSTWD